MAAQLEEDIERRELQDQAYFQRYAGGVGGFSAGFDRVRGQEIDTVPDAGADIAQWIPSGVRRNLVNAYVWTADGGFLVESNQVTGHREESMGGNMSLSAVFGAKVHAGPIEVEALAGGHVRLASYKTQVETQSFGLSVNAVGEGADVTGLDDTPTYPGEKVDAYRFKTFYLAPDGRNFDDFFSQVVDQSWLAGDAADAIALRQAQNSPGQPWRVRHIVTYVSRAGAPAEGDPGPSGNPHGTDQAPAPDAAPPSVVLTEVPNPTANDVTNGLLRGRVLGLDRAASKVAVFVLQEPDGWAIQGPLVDIEADGSLTTATIAGDGVAACVVPSGFTAGSGTLPVGPGVPLAMAASASVDGRTQTAQVRIVRATATGDTVAVSGVATMVDPDGDWVVAVYAGPADEASYPTLVTTAPVSADGTWGPITVPSNAPRLGTVLSLDSAAGQVGDLFPEAPTFGAGIGAVAMTIVLLS